MDYLEEGGESRAYGSKLLFDLVFVIKLLNISAMFGVFFGNKQTSKSHETQAAYVVTEQ